MKIACVGYREWSLNIYERLARTTNHIFLVFRGRNQFDERVLIEFKPDLVLFYGWSWKVSESIWSRFPSLMLHPSPLPRYRGGSPIQNQIIAGERSSKVTLFLINSVIDAGDIVAQEEYSLEGDLSDILGRIELVGYRLTLSIFENGVSGRAQDHAAATYFERRTPDESEITMQELSSKPAVYLHNKVRMLSDPYPNAFIRTCDGKKLLIMKAVIQD